MRVQVRAQVLVWCSTATAMATATTPTSPPALVETTKHPTTPPLVVPLTLGLRVDYEVAAGRTDQSTGGDGGMSTDMGCPRPARHRLHDDRPAGARGWPDSTRATGLARAPDTDMT